MTPRLSTHYAIHHYNRTLIVQLNLQNVVTWFFETLYFTSSSFVEESCVFVCTECATFGDSFVAAWYRCSCRCVWYAAAVCHTEVSTLKMLKVRIMQFPVYS